jgi:YVTN family beta-propeller protein
MEITRRGVISSVAGLTALAATRPAWGQAPTSGPDRVFICNEDSNTLAVVDPASNSVTATVNLTSFDEDPRPPFRYVTGAMAGDGQK